MYKWKLINLKEEFAVIFESVWIPSAGNSQRRSHKQRSPRTHLRNRHLPVIATLRDTYRAVYATFDNLSSIFTSGWKTKHSGRTDDLGKAPDSIQRAGFKSQVGIDLQVALNGLLSPCISVSLHSIHTWPLWDDVAQETVHFRIQRLWKCPPLLYELSCLSYSESTAENGSHIVQIIDTFVSEHGHFVTQPLVNTGVLMLQFWTATLRYPAFGELCEVLMVQFWP